MTTDLQELVQILAEDLGRAVSLEDRKMRLLNYSTHPGPIDQTRYHLLVARRAPPEAIPYVFSHGIAERDGPVRIAPNTALGIEYPRVSFRVCFEGRLFGFLFVIDPQDGIDPDELRLCADAAARAGELLNRERVHRDAERARERELLAVLFGANPAAAAAAAAELHRSGMFAAASGLTVLVVRAEAGGAVAEQAATAIADGLGRLRRAVPARAGLDITLPTHGVFLLALDDRAGSPEGRAQIAARLHAATREALPAAVGELPIRVGVGQVVMQLEQAGRSHETALLAADVGDALDEEPVHVWDDMGVLRMLARFPLARMGREDLPAGLVALLEAERADELLATLDAYFHLGGDVKATAERLVLHRASLYHRLQRIESITGMSLRAGDDRLALHLGLKLARLLGELPRHEGDAA